MASSNITNSHTKEVSKKVGVVIIGRNEGKYLKRAFNSIPKRIIQNCIYVDSGSSDDSIEIARSVAIRVHELSPETPFSAARARLEGADCLIKSNQEIDYLQFIDGDCELFPEWLETAVAHFDKKPHIAILCGRLEEFEPEASIFNWMAAKHWESTPSGEIINCGGIFIVKRRVYSEIGGFDQTLLTMEEQEFCSRVLQHGYKIERLESPMAKHDTALLTVKDWWERAIWGGFGLGLRFKKETFRVRLSYIREHLIWPIAIFLSIGCAVISIMGSIYFLIIPAICLSMLSLLFIRIFLHCLSKKSKFTLSEACKFSFITITRKIPVSIGFLQYFLTHRCEYRPDPHS